MSSPRSHQAQQGPPDDLRGRLPGTTPSTPLFREHEHRPEALDGGCWWFSSNGGGRFDLAAPEGTCYLGETEGVAARERVGRLMAMRVPITESIYRYRVVTEVAAPVLRSPGADLTDPAVLRTGITGELAATSDYRLCQAWAEAIRAAGYGGMRYPPRFTPGGGEAAWAVFGAAGAQPERGTVARRSLLDVLRDLDYPTVRADEQTEASLDVQDAANPPE